MQIPPKFEMLAEVGRGGMGVVYKVRHITLETIHALKMLSPHLAGERDLARRFEREARVMARLAHPHIVRVSDIDEHDGGKYIVMEYVPGADLKVLMAKRGAIPVDQALRIAREVADALAYAHSTGGGVIHRDIKPSNIIVEDESGRAVVTDFGIAKIMDSTDVTRAAVGTPRYSAPEQLFAEAVDGRADVYGLGLVLFEMLTGLEPPGGPGSNSFVKRILGDPSTTLGLPSECAVELPSQLRELILHAAALDPNERFESAGAFRDAIVNVERLLAGAARPGRAAHGAGARVPAAARPRDSAPGGGGWSLGDAALADQTRRYETGDRPDSPAAQGAAPMRQPRPTPSLESEPETVNEAAKRPQGAQVAASGGGRARALIAALGGAAIAAAGLLYYGSGGRERLEKPIRVASAPSPAVAPIVEPVAEPVVEPVAEPIVKPSPLLSPRAPSAAVASKAGTRAEATAPAAVQDPVPVRVEPTATVVARPTAVASAAGRASPAASVAARPSASELAVARVSPVPGPLRLSRAKPAGEVLPLDSGAVQEFSVRAERDGRDLPEAKVKYEWRMDDRPLSRAEERVAVVAGEPGAHRLTVVARADDGATAERAWRLDVRLPKSPGAPAVQPTERAPDTVLGRSPVPVPGRGVVAREVGADSLGGEAESGADERRAAVDREAGVGDRNGRSGSVVARDVPPAESQPQPRAGTTRPGGVVAREEPALAAEPARVPEPALSAVAAVPAPKTRVASGGAPNLEIFGLTNRVAKNRKTVTVEGKIRNDGSDVISRLTLVVHAVDADDAVIVERDVVPASLPLEPGQQTTFRTEMEYKPGIRGFDVVAIVR